MNDDQENPAAQPGTAAAEEAASPTTGNGSGAQGASDSEQQATPAQEARPPVVDGIIRLRTPSGDTVEYSITDWNTANADKVYELLPESWQKKIDAQAAFFENYENTITGIPKELREPGAFEKLFKQMHEQGGHLGDEISAEVRAWLDGPNGAGLRSNGYYKGYATADAIATILARGYKVGSELIPKYFDALLLPVRGAAYATGWMGEKLTNAPTITPEKARTLATAYQGMMYMATESEFAPKETKTQKPNLLGNIVGGIQMGFNYVVVAGIAAWNYAIGWLTGKKVTWDEAWNNAVNSWTKGKGLKSASETAQTNAVAASLEEVRPVIEEQLSRTTIDGEDISRFLGVKEGDFVAGKDGNVSTFAGQDAGLNPLMGPDGKTPLPTSAVQQSELGQVTGGLFQDLSVTGVASTGIAMGAAYGLTYKGIGQGFGNVNADGGFSKLEKQAKAAEKAYTAAEKAYNSYHGKNGLTAKTTNWLGKPIDEGKLATTLSNAYDKWDNLDNKVTLHSGASNVANRKLAQALPADAGFTQRYISHPLTVLGRPVGAAAAHTWNAGSAGATHTWNAGRSWNVNSATTTGKISRGVGIASALVTTEASLRAFNDGNIGEGLGYAGQTAVVGAMAVAPTQNGVKAIARVTGLSTKAVGTKIPVIGAFVGGAFAVVETGYEAYRAARGESSWIKVGGTAVNGVIGTVSGLFGFLSLGAGEVAQEGVREGFTRAFGEEHAPRGSAILALAGIAREKVSAGNPTAAAGALKASTINQAYARAVRNFDANGSGSLSNQEIEAVLASVGVTHKNQVDTNQDGRHSKEEFLSAIGYLNPPAAQVAAVGNKEVDPAMVAAMQEELVRLRQVVANGSGTGTGKTGFDAAALAFNSGSVGASRNG